MDPQLAVARDDVFHTVRLFLRLLRAEARTAALWALCVLVSSLFMLGVPRALRELIDVGFSRGPHAGSAYLGLLALALLLATATAARLYYVNILGDRVTARLRNELFDSLLGKEMAFHQKHSSHELMARLSTDAEYLRILVTSLSISLRSGMILVGSLVMLFLTDLRLASVLFLIVPAALAPILLSSRRLQGLSREHADLLAGAKAKASEALGFVRTVKEYGRESHETRRYSSALERVLATGARRALAQAALSGLSICLIFSSIVLVLWLGAASMASGSMTAGALGQFLLYAIMAGSAAAELVETWSTLQRAAGAISRVHELHEAPQRTPELPALMVRDGRISFDRVHFSYSPDATAPALVDVTLDIASGSSVALVGPSGSGKSTVLALLAGLYAPTRGRILIDGQDISQFSAASLRDSLAVIPQSPTIFSASATYNILYGRLSATQTQVRAASAVARADEFIEKLKAGYDEPLGERGSLLSGGQIQRISLARALLKDAPILLMDEATSALDARTERLVQLAIEEASRGKTKVIVAHRLSSILSADLIVYIENGSLVAQGEHSRLMDECPQYAELIKLSFPAQSVTEHPSTESQPFHPSHAT